MNKSVSAKVWITIGLCTLFFIGMIFYWYNYNAKETIEDIRKDLLSMVDKSRTFPKAKVENVISIQQKVKNKYVNDSLKSVCTEFFKQWNARLSRAQADGFERQIKTESAILESTLSARKGNQLMAVLLITVIFITFVCLAFFTNLLRDPQGNANNTSPIEIEKAFQESQNNKTDKTTQPFSLSRTQLAIWITIISCVYIYAVLWDKRTIGDINNTALLLMGISAGTFVIGAILDTTEIQQKVIRHQEMQPSVNFFRDILTDNNGISVHRFQNVVWTMVAIIVYFYRYSNPPDGNWNDLPTLDSTLLALTGISSATYLTLKTRENVSLKKPVTLKIKLLIDNSIPQKAAIEALPEGLQKAIISIFTNIGDELHAMTDPAAPKNTFIAMVEPDKFQKIEVTWNEKINGTEIKLSGSFADILKDIPDNQSIEITLK